jgi:hypothetical protein
VKALTRRQLEGKALVSESREFTYFIGFSHSLA